jgi:uncharacterized hydrophobic protein (TIGR00341 family)
MKLIEIIADTGSADTVSAIGDKYRCRDFRLGAPDENGMQSMRLLVSDDRAQAVLDSLRHLITAQPYARIIMLPVEVSLPEAPKAERDEEDTATVVREQLYASIEKNARLDANFLLLVFLSTVVAAIGLVENSVAIVIGAMVLAPLLGPNLALGLGTVLGDLPLIRKSLVTTVTGIGFAVLLSALLALVWPFDDTGPELLARSEVGIASVALALASGAAAALSVTTGLPSVLVGVMVAVALLPPAATLGIMLGHGHPDLAIGAGLLLAVNVVCVNLACKVVFMARGIGPLAWSDKAGARRKTLLAIAIWIVTLALLIVAILGRDALRD